MNIFKGLFSKKEKNDKILENINSHPVSTSNPEDLLSKLRYEVFESYLVPKLNNDHKSKMMTLSKFYYFKFHTRLVLKLDQIVNDNPNIKFKESQSKQFLTNQNEKVYFGQGTQDNNSVDSIQIVQNNLLSNCEIVKESNPPYFQKLIKPEPRENFGYQRLDNQLQIQGGYQRFGKFMEGNQLNQGMKEIDGFKDFWKFNLDTHTFTMIINDLQIGKRRAPKCVVLRKGNKIKLMVQGGSDGQTKEQPKHLSVFMFSDKKHNELMDEDQIILPDYIQGRCNHIFYQVAKQNYIIFGFGVQRGTVQNDLQVLELNNKDNSVMQLLGNDNSIGDFAMGVTETQDSIIIFGGKTRNIQIKIIKNLNQKRRPQIMELKTGNFYGDLVQQDGHLQVMMNQQNNKAARLKDISLRNQDEESESEEEGDDQQEQQEGDILDEDNHQ